MARDSAATTVQPYPAGTQWTFTVRSNGLVLTEELVLYYQPAGGSIGEDYLPGEISAADLWRLWIKDANRFHQQWPDRYRPGEVHVMWTVTQPGFLGIFEVAPGVYGERRLPGEIAESGVQENFLTFYTHPVHAETGERLNWLRLPVLDLGWNASANDVAGFIQEATGWKPSPLQQTMDVVQIGRAAGLPVPDLD
ncbi:hypothetical protein ABZ918_10455 [Streptomyces viridosporus]|uniref:hypothetical protein n=1 Tax=Streptomyces viridosporus TaxID=67581 RepID=UPI00343914AE